jgi:hypothetical protein
MLAGSSSVFRMLPVSVAGSAAEAELEAAAVAGDDPEAGDDPAADADPAAAGGVVLELPPQPAAASTAEPTSPAIPAPRSQPTQFCDLSRENTTKPSEWRAIN